MSRGRRARKSGRLAVMDAGQSLERAYRDEATRIRASLAARTGDVGLAEDAVQDAFVEAIEHWRREGVPPNPGGWLATTARRKALDRLRRDKAGAEKLALLAAGDPAARPDGRDGPACPDGAAGRQADDELLGLVFACCHPALPEQAQVALTLRAVCGLTTDQIASAFLVSEPTMAQRLLRARRSLHQAQAEVRVPDPDELGGRLAGVLSVVYLVFNEGYLASSGREPARRDLSAQAIALTRTLHRLMPREPEVLGLLALLLLHESRAAARFDGWGRLIRLAEQDRSRWDRGLVREAVVLLDRAIALRRPGPYQVQAAIAALHAEAPRYEETDWRQIRLLYSRLQQLAPSPVVLLNRAVATRYAVGAEAAIAEIEPLSADLDGYHLFHALRAGLLAALGRHEEAAHASERALALAVNPAERELLTRGMSLLARGDDPPEPPGCLRRPCAAGRAATFGPRGPPAACGGLVLPAGPRPSVPGPPGCLRRPCAAGRAATFGPRAPPAACGGLVLPAGPRPSVPGPPGCLRRPRSPHFHDRAELDRDPAPVDSRPGLGDLDRLVHRLGVEHRVAAEHLLGLDERPVGDAGRPHGPGRLRPLELVAGAQLAGRAPLLVPGADLGEPGVELGAARCRLVRGVHDQHHVLHARLLVLGVPACKAPSRRIPRTGAAGSDTRRHLPFGRKMIFPRLRGISRVLCRGRRGRRAAVEGGWHDHPARLAPVLHGFSTVRMADLIVYLESGHAAEAVRCAELFTLQARAYR